MTPSEPLHLRDVSIGHRLWLSPMCMYSSVGEPTGAVADWHVSHLEARAVGGAALAMVEATAVHPDGRVSPGDLGVWDDAHVPGLTRLVDAVTRHGSVPALQLGHAGIKASTHAPWRGRHVRVDPTEGGWVPWAPSARAEGPPVRPLGRDEVHAVPALYAAAARRAAAAGFRVVEIHAAHGYLIHDFLSPLTNRRDDEYGRDRGLLLKSVVEAVRGAWPESLPLFVRLSAVDWVEGGLTLEDSVATADSVRDLGVDLIDVSSGGLGAPTQVSPGYQVPFASRIREATGMPVAAVGLIEDPGHVAEILAGGHADAVFAGRAFLRDPYWARHVLDAHGTSTPWPDQYGWAIG